MIKQILILSLIALNSCTSSVGNEHSMHEDFYDLKAKLEDQCRMSAQELYPAYPARRGVLINYWFTRAYEQCLEKKTSNGEIPTVSGS